VRETEGRILEISTLNHLFSTQVVQQAQKIEQLYQEALHATVHMQRGNAELVKAHGYNSSGRKWFVLLMLMASLVLLVLDYITP
jgi:syntaxin 18